MTSQWAWWRLKSPASRLFTQSFIQTQIKENIKAPRHWPLCGEFTGTGEFPAQMASYAENVSIWWRHHDSVDSVLSGIKIKDATWAILGAPDYRRKLFKVFKLLFFRIILKQQVTKWNMRIILWQYSHWLFKGNIVILSASKHSATTSQQPQARLQNIRKFCFRSHELICRTIMPIYNNETPFLV